MIVMTHGIATDSFYWALRSAFLGEELEDAKCKLSLGKTVALREVTCLCFPNG